MSGPFNTARHEGLSCINISSAFHTADISISHILEQKKKDKIFLCHTRKACLNNPIKLKIKKKRTIHRHWCPAVRGMKNTKHGSWQSHWLTFVMSLKPGASAGLFLNNINKSYHWADFITSILSALFSPEPTQLYSVSFLHFSRCILVAHHMSYISDSTWPMVSFSLWWCPHCRQQ